MTKIQVGFNPFSEAEFTMELCAKVGSIIKLIQDYHHCYVK